MNIQGVTKIMRNSIFLILAMMLLFLGSVSAAFVTTEFTRSPVVSVTNLEGRYTNACAKFTWDAGAAPDFNNFVLRVTSNNSDFSGDINTTNNWYNACTIVPGEWVKVVVFKVDGNSEGYFLNFEPDVNTTVFPGNVTQAGTFMIYNILVAVGGLVSLVILAVIFGLVFKKIGMGNILKK